jgi:hypothetical protein
MPIIATKERITTAFKSILKEIIASNKETLKDKIKIKIQEKLRSINTSNIIDIHFVEEKNTKSYHFYYNDEKDEPETYSICIFSLGTFKTSYVLKTTPLLADSQSYQEDNQGNYTVVEDSLLEKKLSEQGLLKEEEIDINNTPKITSPQTQSRGSQTNNRPVEEKVKEKKIDTNKTAVITAASKSSQLDASSEENKDSFGENLNLAALLLGLFEAAANAQSVMTTMDLNLNDSENTYFLMNLVGGWICPIFCTEGTFTGLRPLLSFTVIIMAALDKVPAVNEKRKTLLNKVNSFFSKGIQDITKSVGFSMQN